MCTIIHNCIWPGGDPITQRLPCQSRRQLNELLKIEVLDLLQKVFYTSDAARESFVELCEEEYVQKATNVDSWSKQMETQMSDWGGNRLFGH